MRRLAGRGLSRADVRLPELGVTITLHRARRCDARHANHAGRNIRPGIYPSCHSTVTTRPCGWLMIPEYGLAASVWTRDSKRGERLARRIHAGTVMVNDVISCFGISESPHGGVKSSGVGRTHGRFGLDEMVRLKYLDIDLMPGMKKVWWHRYGDTFRRQMEGFLDMQFGRGMGLGFVEHCERQGSFGASSFKRRRAYRFHNAIQIACSGGCAPSPLVSLTWYCSRRKIRANDRPNRSPFALPHPGKTWAAVAWAWCTRPRTPTSVVSWP